MLDLNASRIFVCVVEENGFTAAAKRLEMPKQTVSRRISELEKYLGIRLLERSTRKIRLTSTGQAFFDQAQKFVHLSEQAEEIVLDSKLEPSGSIHIATSHLLCELVLNETIITYMKKYPKVQLKLTIAENELHLYDQNIDIGFAVGNIKDSSLISKTLSTTKLHCYASELFIETHGIPSHPQEIADLPIIFFKDSLYSPSNTWEFTRELSSGDENTQVNLTPKLSVPSFWLARNALLQGIGIARLPAALMQYDVEQGNLVQLFPEWTPPKVNLVALFPSRKLMSLPVRTFLNELEQTMHSYPNQLTQSEIDTSSQIKLIEPRTEFIQ